MQLDGPRLPAGVIGQGGPGHALTRTSTTGTTEVGALPSLRVPHAYRRYYDPVRLTLPSLGLHHRLIPRVFAGRRRARRASLVPRRTVLTCRSPYPGGTRRADPWGPSERRRSNPDSRRRSHPLPLIRSRRAG